MRSLLAYYFKTKWHIIIILSVICFTMSIAALAISANTGLYYSILISTVLVVLGLILSTVIPMFIFSFKMKKTNIDQLYSLGIKRSKLFLTKFIFGLIILIVPITVAYIPVFFTITDVEINKVLLIEYYIFIILSFISIYTIISFVYTRANTIIDGIFISIIYMFILAPIAHYICDAFNIISIDFSWFFLYAPSVCIYRTYYLIFEFNSMEMGYVFTADIFSFIFFGVLTIVSFVLFVILNKKDKAENTGQISDSYFGYKTLIPILIASLLSIYELNNYVLIIITIISAYLLTSIYKRSFKINKKYYFIILGAIALGFILNIINS